MIKLYLKIKNKTKDKKITQDITEDNNITKEINDGNNVTKENNITKVITGYIAESNHVNW